MHDATPIGQVELLTQEKFELIGENENLRKRIKQLQEQVAKPSGIRFDKAFISKKKKTLQEEVEQLGNELEEFKVKLQGETDQKMALQQNLKFLQTAYQESKQESERWRKASDHAMAEAAQCRQQLLQLTAEQSSLKGSLARAQAERQELEEARACMEKEIYVLKKELTITTASEDATGETGGSNLKELLRENFDLARQVEDVQQKLKLATEGHDAALESATVLAQSTFERLTAEYSLGLSAHFSTLLLDSAADYGEAVAQHCAELLSFREEVGTCSTENAELKLQLGRRTAELAAVRKEVEEKRSQLNAMFESLAHVQRKAEGLTEEVTTCERLKKENQLLAMQATRLQDNLQEKDRQLAATCQSLHEAETTLARKAALTGQLEDQVVELQRRAEQAEADTLRRHMAETSARRQLEDLRAEMSDMKGVAETQHIDSLTFSTQLDSLQASLQDAQSRLACEKTELLKVTSAKQHLEIEVDQLSSELFIAKSRRDESLAFAEELRRQKAEVARCLETVSERLQRTEADFVEVAVLDRVLLSVERDHYRQRCLRLEEDSRHLRSQLMAACEQQETHRAHAEDLLKQAEIDTRRQFMFIRELQAQLASTAAAPPPLAGSPEARRAHHQRMLSGSSSQCASEYSRSQSPEPAGQFSLPSWDAVQLSDRGLGVSEDELVLLDRVTRLQVANWELEERLKGAELRVQKLEDSIARKDEVLQHWIAQRPITQELPKRRLKGLLPAKSTPIKQATQQQMQTLVEQTTIQNLMFQEKIEVLQTELQAMQHHHLHCSLTATTSSNRTTPPPDRPPDGTAPPSPASPAL